MAYSDVLERRFRILQRAHWVGFPIFAICTIPAAFGKQWGLALFIAAFAPLWLGFMCAYWLGFRCPECGGNLGEVYRRRWALKGGGPLRVCPYCGEDFRDDGPGPDISFDE